MATVKVTLDTRSNSKSKDSKFPLVLRLGHKSKTRDIPFNLLLKASQFDESTQAITGIQNSVRHTKRIRKQYGEIDLWLDENKADIKLWPIMKLKDEIERQFFKKQSSLNLIEHATKYLYRFAQKNKFSTIDSYEAALKVFVKYRMKLARIDDDVKINTLFEKDRSNGFVVKEDYRVFDVTIKSIDNEFIKDFQAYMSGRFKSKNSVNIHLRSLQAIMNDAESTYPELKGHKPLDGVKKKSSANKPVVLTYDEIDAIRNLPLDPDCSQDHVRNYFLFMFNNMGMNFYDVALARVHQFDGKSFSYTRKKTEEEGDHFMIAQNSENISIIKKYSKGKNGDDYMFPIIPKDTPISRIHRVKADRLKWFNENFKKIGSTLGINKKLTTYTARDTWTNLGLQMNIDIRKISSGLGHSSIDLTEKHYSESIQYKMLNEINAMITNRPKME